MSRKDKWFEDKSESFSRLYEDVGQNNVKIYAVDDYEQKCKIPVHPEDFLDRCSEVIVACSGEQPTGNDWMVIVPCRVDSDSGEKVCDIDPVLTVLDTDSGDPHPSGVVAYHQKFDGRTTEIEGYGHGTIETTVSDLRANLTTGAMPLQEGPEPVLNALAHMHRKYKDNFEAE